MNNRLKELRLRTLKDNGKPMTQKEVAEKIGCDEATYNQWEKEKTTIQRLDYAKKLCELFGVSMDYLLGISDYRRNENENICQELGLSEKAVNNLRKYRKESGVLSDIIGTRFFYELLKGLDEYIHSDDYFEGYGVEKDLFETMAKDKIQNALYEIKRKNS